MKKSTWIVVLVAVALGAGVYFYEVRRGSSRDAAEETTKPAFAFRPNDIAVLTLTRSGQTVVVEKHDEEWVITQPVHTRADQGAIDSVASGVASARISRTLSASPDRLQTYGLDNPAVTLDIKLKSSEQHRLGLGSKDFSGLLVYALLDRSGDVALLPDTLLASANKPLDELRDRSVLDITQWDVAAFDVQNRSGEIRVAKQGSDWVIEKPRHAAADPTAVGSLLSEVSTAKMTEVVSETAENVSKYGLKKPGLSFRARLLNGKERALLIGNQAGNQYLARETSRSIVFRVGPELYNKLNVTFFQLRDKRIVHFKPDDLARVEVRNRHQTLVGEKNAEGKWTVKQPAEKKDQEIQSWKLFDPLETTRAKGIFDSPPARVATRLARPAVELELTDKSGKITRIAISSPSGDDVYVRTAAAPTVYKAGKQLFDALNFKLAEIVF